MACAANHWVFVSDQEYYVALVALGPLTAMIGLGGLVEPRLIMAIGVHGKALPFRLRLAGHLLVFAGLATSVALVFFVYGWRVGGSF
jgi:hypothetical protein